MLYNVFWPIIEFIMWYMMRFIYRLMDNPCFYLCCCNKTYKFDTKTKSIPQYLEIYSGPAYLIHYKYSSLINIVFITFMFGAGLPILFPIAYASFFVFYVVERLLVAYSYREPPLFDQTLNREALQLIKFAPLIYCAITFWMFGNRQIFGTEVYYLQKYS